MPGIGPDLHRVLFIEVVARGLWRRPALEVRGACGIKMVLPGLLFRPQFGDVTCPICLSR